MLAIKERVRVWGFAKLAAVILLQFAGIARISEVFGLIRRKLSFGKGGLGWGGGWAGLAWGYEG